jgi:hypothetical protein
VGKNPPLMVFRLAFAGGLALADAFVRWTLASGFLATGGESLLAIVFRARFFSIWRQHRKLLLSDVSHQPFFNG